MLMAVIAWVSAAPDAEAWTARELAEAYNSGLEIWSGSGNQNSYLLSSRNVELYATNLSNGTEVLVIHNFLGAFDVFFKVEEVQGQNGPFTMLTCCNEYLFDAVNAPASYGGYDGIYSLEILRAERVNNDYYPVYYSNYYGYNTAGYGYNTGKYYFDDAMDQPLATYPGGKEWAYATAEQLNSLEWANGWWHDTEWKGQIVDNDGFGHPYIIFGPYNDWNDSMTAQMNYLDADGNRLGTSTRPASELFDGYILTLYNNNASYSDSNSGKYSGGVDILENNQFGLLNFANFGAVYANGEEYSDNENMPYAWGEITGTAEGNKFVIPMQEFYSSVSGTKQSAYKNLSYENRYIFGYNPETQQRNPDNEVTGTIEQGIPVHYGNKDRWVHTVPGGDLHTYIGGIIKLDPWGSTDGSTDTNPPHWTSYEASVKNTEIVYADFKSDITFDCDLQVTLGDTYGDNGKDYVKAEFALTEKDGFCSDYTTHYDVYYLEGEYTHAANVPVEQAKKIQTVVFDDNKKTYTFSYDLPYPEGYEPTENPTESQKYTFFVVAHYNAAEMADAQVKAATNGSAAHLEATYHALTTVGKPLPTALNGLAVAEAQIKVVSGAVVVEGFDGVVEVYNAQGACVYTGTDSRIELNGGVYIVRAGTKAVKVVIG